MSGDILQISIRDAKKIKDVDDCHGDISGRTRDGKATLFRLIASMISVTFYLTMMKMPNCPVLGSLPLTTLFFSPVFAAAAAATAVDLGGHGPIQPTHPRHLGDQFPHLPVALPQSQPLGVRARQPRLPQPQRQAEGGMELEVT